MQIFIALHVRSKPAYCGGEPLLAAHAGIYLVEELTLDWAVLASKLRKLLRE
jgi:hypothetical protein